MRLYGSIQKVDAEKRMVYGYASTEARDRAGEIVLKSAIEAALGDYLEFANIREMHQLSAVGTAEEATVDDKGLYIAAKIVDEAAWGKVTSGVYKGFSIGGKTLERDPKDRKVITRVRLDEISLVDRPANPEARFDVWKAAGATDEGSHMPNSEAPAEIGETKIESTEADLEKAAQEREAAEIAEAEDYFAKREFNAADRKKDAKSGAAMKDGSFPIENETDLKNAVRLAGRAKDPAAARAHIKKRAKSLGLSDMIPDTWKAAAPEAAAEDGLAKANAALDAIEAKLAGGGLEKNMWSVSRFADMLNSIAWLHRDARDERDLEGDGSPIPEKLRDWLKAGVAIFKDMAKEEGDELVVAAEAVKKAAETDDLAKAAEEAKAKADADAAEAVAKVIAERDELAKRFDEQAEQMAALTTRVDTVFGALTKRLDDFALSPAPRKTAGPGAGFIAIEKHEDAAGSVTKTVDSATDEESISKAVADALAGMSDEERALVLIKASQKLPHRVTMR